MNRNEDIIIAGLRIWEEEVKRHIQGFTPDLKTVLVVDESRCNGQIEMRTELELVNK